MLDCNHRCPSKCHSDHLHDAVKCMVNVTRKKKACEHFYITPCFQEESGSRCMIRVPNPEPILSCGHAQNEVYCYEAQDTSLTRCLETVKYTFPACKHSIETSCALNYGIEKSKCTMKCGKKLACGHMCTRPCFACVSTDSDGTVREQHGDCIAVCGKRFDGCPHHCKASCHLGQPCLPCTSKCEVRCVHTRCDKGCGECVPCTAETCTLGCEHSRCTMPCGIPCDHIPCAKRCTRRLLCRHV